MQNYFRTLQIVTFFKHFFCYILFAIDHEKNRKLKASSCLSFYKKRKLIFGDSKQPIAYETSALNKTLPKYQQHKIYFCSSRHILYITTTFIHIITLLNFAIVYFTNQT